MENAKSDSRRCHIRKHKFNLTELLLNLGREYQEIASYQGKTFHYRGQEIELNSDSISIERIVRNLLNNALKYGRGKISLHWYKIADKAKIIVADNGVGLKPEEQKHLFEAFYQCRRHKSLGSGLGLSIVKELADEFNISLNIYSKWKKGTIVVLQIPL